MNAWLPWCNQFTGDEKDCIFNRASNVITRSEVAAAIEWYEKQFGAPPKQIATCLDFELPDGIELVKHGGVLKFEVWLSTELAEKPFPKPLSEKTPSAPTTKPAPEAPKQKSGEVAPPTSKDVPATLETLTPPPEMALKANINETKKKKERIIVGVLGRPNKVSDVSWVTLYRRGDPSYKKVRKARMAGIMKQQGVLAV